MDDQHRYTGVYGPDLGVPQQPKSVLRLSLEMLDKYSLELAATTTTVWATFNACVGRGLDNGARRAQLTMTLVSEIMRHVRGFSMQADLPK